MSDWSTSSSKSGSKHKVKPKEENKILVSEHQIWLKNIDGLNEVDLEEIFAEYDLVESFIVDQQPPFAFLTFRDPSVVQELLDQKSFYCDKNQKYLIMQPAKVKNPQEHERLLERIKKTKNIAQQQIVGVQLIGHSADTVIDLSQKQVKFKVRIQNRTPLAKTLNYVRMQGQRKFFKFEIPKRYDKTRIPPSGSVDIDVEFSHELDHPANCMQTLTIEVDKYRFPYHLIVNLSALDEVALLSKKGDYKQQSELEFPQRIVPAFPPERKSTTHFHTPAETFYVEDLGLYPVPDDIHQQVMDKDTYHGFNPWKVKDNWKQRLHELLYIEEVEQEKKSHRYDLRDVTVPMVPWEEGLTYGIDTRDVLSEISVPGLAENRPSVLFNDYVFAWPVGGTDYAYEGWVYKVKEKSILVMFHTDFHRTFKPETLFNVRFRFNRMPMRLRHRSIDNIDMDLFWPTSIPEHVPKKYSVETLRWTDMKMKANPEQSEAIVNMLNGTNGTAPYLIFGPFGTGKTRCLVEYAKQVLALQKDSKLLICAQSNSGSDKITRELMQILKPNEMFRLYAFNQKRIEFDILPYTRRDETNNIYIPPNREELKNYRVVISTANNSATIFGLGVGRNHFTHIMIDEAAQMMEPEAAIPLCLASKGTKILLVGDNKQTGPRIFSRVAKHHGLEKSLMERLLANEFYRGQANKATCMNLIRNYRSHPKIISLLSELFYENKLLCCTSKEEYTSLERWNKRGTKQDFPFLFYALDNTKEDREEDSPSFFNIDEAITICSLVKNLLDQVRTISEEEVCVVTASHKQSVKIRQLMRKKDLRGVNVASTEEFQGREYKAIFMSTVRSSSTYLDHDRQYNIGFIEDEKRFNTALSRAVALVVIVGNSKILARSPVWAKTIRYCSSNNSYMNFMHDPKAKDEEEEEDAQFLTTSNNTVAFPALNGDELSQSNDSLNDAMKSYAEDTIREAEEIKRSEQRQKELEAKERARAAAKAKKLELKTSSPEFRPAPNIGGSASNVPPPSQSLTPTPSPLSKSANAIPVPQANNPLSASAELLQRSANPVIPVQNPWNQPVLVQTPQHLLHQQAGGVVQPVGQGISQVQQMQPSPQLLHMQQQLEHLHLLQQQHAQFGGSVVQQPLPQQAQLQPHQYALQPSQYAPGVQQPQVQQHPHVIGQMQQPQMNGQDDDSWTSVDKTKSATLSMFLGKELIVALKDRGLKGYPPFCVIEGQTELRICFSKFLLRDSAPRPTSDGKSMFVEFATMIPPNVSGFNLLTAVPSIIPFTPSISMGTVENNLVICKVKINVPEHYSLSTWQSDDHSLFIFFRKQAMQYPMIFGNS